MRALFDQIAYRLLARGHVYTPEYHYRLRALVARERPDILGRTGYGLPYWRSMVMMRLADVYWSIRGLVER